MLHSHMMPLPTLSVLNLNFFTQFQHHILNSLLANIDFCHLLMSFANTLDPDQDRQIVGPDLDSNYLTL